MYKILVFGKVNTFFEKYTMMKRLFIIFVKKLRI